MANPTWDASVTWAVASGASTDNFTIYWTRFGPERIVRFVADGSFVANDFIFFDSGTIADSDMPAYTEQDFFCRHMSDSKTLVPGNFGIDVTFFTCVDGSAILGQKVFGGDGPYIEDFPFDTSLIGSDFILTTSETRYLTTIDPGPAVTALAVGLPNRTKGQSLAQAFGNQIKLARASPNPPRTFPWLHNK